jgi:hypothetical protein
MPSAERRVRGAVFFSLAVLTLALLAGSMSSSWRAIAQGRSATAEQPARIPVAVPQAKDVKALVIAIKAFRKPVVGNVGGIVRLKRLGATQSVEVGRFSIFPSESFAAASAADEKRYRFEIAGALKQLELAGGQAEVEVALFDRSGGQIPAGAELTVGSAQIVAR